MAAAWLPAEDYLLLIKSSRTRLRIHLWIDLSLPVQKCLYLPSIYPSPLPPYLPHADLGTGTRMRLFSNIFPSLAQSLIPNKNRRLVDVVRMVNCVRYPQQGGKECAASSCAHAMCYSITSASSSEWGSCVTDCVRANPGYRSVPASEHPSSWNPSPFCPVILLFLLRLALC